MAGSTATILTREQLKDIKNLFVVTPDNINYLLGTSKWRPGATRRNVPLLMFTLAVILVSCPLTAALGANDGQGTFWLLSIVIAVPCLLGIVVAFRAYRRSTRLDRGQLLQATITSVSTSESSRTSGLLQTLLALLIAVNTGDFYEVTLQYTASTPSGTQISGTIRQNRPDLRAGGLPHVGDPIVVLYFSESLYKVM